MTRLALLSCALLVACGGGGQQSTDKIYDFAGLDLFGEQVNDGGVLVTTDLNGVDLSGPLGPEIKIKSPTAMTAHGQVMIDVVVTDQKSTVQASKVVCSILSNGDTPLTAVAGSNPLELTGPVVFSTYNPVLNGNVVITIDATDDAGNKATATITFTVDNDGPIISMITPAEGAFIGGFTHISATIVDGTMTVPGSGVDPTSVVATFTADTTFNVPLVMTTPNTFEADFDATRLGTSFVLPTLTVIAADVVGNKSDVSYELKADNVQPFLSLDPPKTQVWFLNTTTGLRECSRSFNPVGDDALTDGYNSTAERQVFTLRAQVEDHGNHASGQTIDYISGIAAGTVRLVAIPASPPTGTNKPPVIAVDTNGDTICDSLNPELVAVTAGMGSTSSSQYLAIGMSALAASGTPDYRPDSEPVPADCDVIGDPTVTMPPAPLCDAAPVGFGYVLEYTDPGTPAIWSLPLVDSTPLGCVGEQFDSLNLLPEGWACFAAVANDNTGNPGISAPLRACIRRTSASPHPCDTDPMPDCTGTYTMATGTTSTACTPALFDGSIQQVH